LTDINPLDASRVQALKAATAEKQARRRQMVLRDLRVVLALPEGRRTIWWLLDAMCRVNDDSHDPSSPFTTAYNEGRRSVGVGLQQHVVAASADAYVRMLTERTLYDDDGNPFPAPGGHPDALRVQPPGGAVTCE